MFTLQRTDFSEHITKHISGITLALILNRFQLSLRERRKVVSEEYVSVKEFAAMFGYSPKYVRSLIQSGAIPAFRLETESRGGDWRIDLNQIKLEKNTYSDTEKYKEKSVESSFTVNRRTKNKSEKILKNLKKY